MIKKSRRTFKYLKNRKRRRESDFKLLVLLFIIKLYAQSDIFNIKFQISIKISQLVKHIYWQRMSTEHCKYSLAIKWRGFYGIFKERFENLSKMQVRCQDRHKHLRWRDFQKLLTTYIRELLLHLRC